MHLNIYWELAYEQKSHRNASHTSLCIIHDSKLIPRFEVLAAVLKFPGCHAILTGK
jgi:hypothetical protein